jgi:hypothetical protein
MMGMAADDNAKPCCGRVQVKAVEVMEKIKHASSDLDCPGFGQIPSPIFPVHISPDRINRSNRSQGGENLRGAHIACMENEFNASEGPEGLGSNQAVGVGYDSYSVRSSWFCFSHHGTEIFQVKHGRAVCEPPLSLFVFLQLLGILGGGIEESPGYVHPGIISDPIHHILDFHDACREMEEPRLLLRNPGFSRQTYRRAQNFSVTFPSTRLGKEPRFTGW